jgi:hypothetical protein
MPLCAAAAAACRDRLPVTQALNAARPDDPLQFLAEFLLQHKTATAH